MEREIASIEELLVHADWVGSLARRLVRDREGAEDLAQEAWLAAVKEPPREARSARAWLSRVVVNLARQRGRSDGVREQREDGTFAFDALGPGTWIVSVPGAEPDSAEVEVLESDALLELEFTLR